MKLKGTDMYITREDRVVLTITMEEDGVALPFVSGDSLRLSVRAAMPYDSQELGTEVAATYGNLDSKTGSMVLVIQPINTKKLKFGFGQYVYDIRADLKSRGWTTLVPESAFVLLREVTTSI